MAYIKTRTSIWRLLTFTFFAISITACMPTWGQVGGYAGAGCGASGCNGRCTFGVEGTCVPRRSTFGHYTTTWRRWPEPAPEIPKRPQVAPGPEGGQLDLPEAMDESESNPDFSHLKPAGPAAPETDAVVPDAVVPDTVVPDTVVPDTAPDNSDVDDIGPTGPAGGGNDAIDLPTPELDASPLDLEGDLLDTPVPTPTESRVQPDDAPGVRLVGSQGAVAPGNPLRFSPTSQPKLLPITTPVTSHPLRTPGSGFPSRVKNPLR